MATIEERAHFKTGDQVAHPKRPEWGKGLVITATPITHQGKKAQRLTINFPNKGRVVINAGVVPLELLGNIAPEPEAAASTRPSATSWNTPAKAATATATAEVSDKPVADPAAALLDPEIERGWLDQLEGKKPQHMEDLSELPDACVNPFASLEERMRATLELYRFTTDPRHILDWAVMQSGMDDPMIKHTRQELEQAFQRFARNRENQLHDIVRQLKYKRQRSIVDQTMSSLKDKTAREALKKALRA